MTKNRTILRFALALGAVSLLAAVAPTSAYAASYYAIAPISGAVNAAYSRRPVTLALASVTPPGAIVGEPYSFDLAGLLSLDGPTGTDASRVRWSISGDLPAGLNLLPSGVISGTPSAAGAGTYAITASYPSDYGRSTATAQNYTFAVEERISGSQFFTASGTFVAPYTGTYNIVIVGWGGHGGSGGTRPVSNSLGGADVYGGSGGGGGGAGAVWAGTLALQQGQSYAVTLGPGVASTFGGASAAPGGNGGLGGNGTRLPSSGPAAGVGGIPGAASGAAGMYPSTGGPGGAGAAGYVSSLLPVTGSSILGTPGAAGKSDIPDYYYAVGGQAGIGWGAGGGGGGGGTGAYVMNAVLGGAGGAGAPGLVFIQW